MTVALSAYSLKVTVNDKAYPLGSSQTAAWPSGLGKETQAQSTEDAHRWWEAYQLAEAGEIDELQARVDAGDEHARWHLASLLADYRRESEAANLIRPLAEAGDEVAAMWLARWLAGGDSYRFGSGDTAELRERAQAGDYYSIQALAYVLAIQGRIAELRELLCPDGPVRPELAAWLTRQSDVEVLRLGADAGDETCQRNLAHWLARFGEVDELRRRAAAGEPRAQWWLDNLPER